MTSLAEVSSLIVELEHWLPRARQMLDLEFDGLRSPNLDGRTSGGGVSDPVGNLVASAEQRGQRLEAVEIQLRDARHLLTGAYSLSWRKPGTPALSLPHDHLEAMRTLVEALQRLAEDQDGYHYDTDGLVADRIQDAGKTLASALGVVHSCQPRLGPEWETVIDEQGKRHATHVGFGIPACINCQPYTFSPARPDANGLCNWCYEWRLAHGRLPFPELVQVHASGKHITSAAYDLACKAAARREAEEKAKKRVHRRKVKR